MAVAVKICFGSLEPPLPGKFDSMCVRTSFSYMCIYISALLWRSSGNTAGHHLQNEEVLSHQVMPKLLIDINCYTLSLQTHLLSFPKGVIWHWNFCSNFIDLYPVFLNSRLSWGGRKTLLNCLSLEENNRIEEMGFSPPTENLSSTAGQKCFTDWE